MNSRAASLTVVGLLVLVTLVACTEREAGLPMTAPLESAGEPSEPSDTARPSGSATPTVQIPARPKELKLDGIDPCTLFTEAQLDQLEIDRKPRSYISNDSSRAPTCALSVERKEPTRHYAVRAISIEGIEAWLTGKRNVDAWLVSVGGFPAAQFKTMGTEKADCVTSVGVAEGQQLHIDMSNNGKGDFTYKQMCEMTQQAAGMALQTLQTLR